MATERRLRVPAWAVPCALLAALAGACQGDASTPSVEASEFCDAYVDVVCDGLEQCCDEISPYEDARCRREQLAECETFILTVDDRGVAPSGPNVPARIVFDFDERGARQALSSLTGQFTRCEGPGASSMFDATHFLGEPGAECLRHEDCAEGTRCVQPPFAVFGTCVRAPLEGEECEDLCGSRELWCVEDEGSDFVCVALRDEGQSCDRVPCADGLICRSSGTVGDPIGNPIGEPGGFPFGGTARCVAGGELGQACDADSECVSGYCHSGRCDDDGSQLGAFCDSFRPGGP